MMSPDHEGFGPGMQDEKPGGNRLWGQAEYLLWWIKDSNIPPLATVGTTANHGALVPGTTILFGGDDVDNEERSGGRFTIGYWFDDCHTWGVEGSYLFLGSRSVPFAANCPANGGVLARPFFNLSTGIQDAEDICFPGLAHGSIQINSTSRLQGFEGNAVYGLCESCCTRLELLAGFRYLELVEGLGINENVAVEPGVPQIGGRTFAVSDQFDTRSQFYGGQVGIRAERSWNKFFVNATAKVALGVSEDEIHVFGQTVTTFPNGARSAVPGGLLALGSNSGRFGHDQFAVVPEGTVNVGYQVTSWLRGYVGYTFLYDSDVVRPGNQIDLTLNQTRIPTSTNFAPSGPNRPSVPTFAESSFWAQGINFGLELRY
jgi:hypothetical protein